MPDPTRFETEWVDYFLRYADALRLPGLTLIVVLVPNKFTAYLPMIEGPAQGDGAALLNGLEVRLRVQRIPTVNLTSVFRARAGQALMSGHYLYWIDDTHWNAAGVDLAAAQVSGEIYALRAGGSSHRKSG